MSIAQLFCSDWKSAVEASSPWTSATRSGDNRTTRLIRFRGQDAIDNVFGLIIV